ncbi:MAG: tRNA-intron lyase [Ignisphaera sp.]|uniref:tRNA-intron lyase n=1 Tax=Ignisphaera aggregans TaxID=334771 RepID=A0A7C4NLJ9_9CREN
MAVHDKSILAEASVVGRKAITLDVEEGGILFKQFYGKPLAVAKPRVDQKYEEPLVLSLYEALYLCERNTIKVEIGGEHVDCETLKQYCRKVSHNFDVKYKVYKYLRDRNYIIRSGIKYGADFAVYTLGPGYEHAPYVVVVAPKHYKLRPADIVALGRVSHSVKKRTVLAIVDENRDNIHYIVFKWVKI